jgi:hypothetical protein
MKIEDEDEIDIDEIVEGLEKCSQLQLFFLNCNLWFFIFKYKLRTSKIWGSIKRLYYKLTGQLIDL